MRFVRYSTFTAMGTCLLVLIGEMLRAPTWMMTSSLLLGMGVVSYQCLGPLQRIMAPMIARDNARRGRTGRNWVYESMYGRTAIISCCVLLLLAVVGLHWLESLA